MIAQRRDQTTYLLSKNPEMRLWHCHYAHASNAQIIQVSKLVDKIKLLDIAISNSNDNQYSTNSKADDEEKSEPDINMHITPIPALLNKIMESIKNLCNMCIKSKHIKIIKYKVIIPILRKLKEIHANLWSLHDPPFISEKSYIDLLLDKYI